MRVGERPELPPERDLRRVVQPLVPEEDHLVPVQRVFQLPHRLRRQRAGDIDTGDVGADMAGYRPDGDRDGFVHDGHAHPLGETAVPSQADRAAAQKSIFMIKILGIG
jgi:hypothetical protein